MSQIHNWDSNIDNSKNISTILYFDVDKDLLRIVYTLLVWLAGKFEHFRILYLTNMGAKI